MFVNMLFIGSILLQEELDYEFKKSYDLTVKATDFQTGSFSNTIVHIDLEVGIYMQVMTLCKVHINNIYIGTVF